MAQARPTTQQVRSDDIRTHLGQRIATLMTEAPRARAGALAGELDQVRRIAQAHGLYPAVAVAQALEGALARGERGPLVKGWLGVLHDAVRCDRHDDAACEAFAAACSVRLSA